MEYQWRLEEFLQTRPGPLRRQPVSCGYLTVRHTAARVLTHPSFYINETLSRVNPQ